MAAVEVKVTQAVALQAQRHLTLETVRLYLAALQAHLSVEFLSKSRAELQTLVAALTRRVEESYAAEADLMKIHTEAARMDTAGAHEVGLQPLRNRAFHAA